MNLRRSSTLVNVIYEEVTEIMKLRLNMVNITVVTWERENNAECVTSVKNRLNISYNVKAYTRKLAGKSMNGWWKLKFNIEELKQMMTCPYKAQFKSWTIVLSETTHQIMNQQWTRMRKQSHIRGILET